MITLLANWKTKALALLGLLTSALMLYISSLKRKALSKEIEQKDRLSEVKDKATEAMVEGLENETKKYPKRNYFGNGK